MTEMEIGSEFQLIDKDCGAGLKLTEEVITDYTFTFSGRTAIETVLENEKNISKVYIPSYCCDSIIEPFVKANIEVVFYAINYKEGLDIEFNIPDDIDCVLWCNYFGFNAQMPNVEEFIDRGGIVIEDITHSLLSEKKFHESSTYLVASIRKWFPILSGGYCATVKNKLSYKPKHIPPRYFLDNKISAMSLKREYLKGDKNIDIFLKKFKSCNEWLEENYSGLTIDKYSADFLYNLDEAYIRLKRKKNAEALYLNLKNNNDIKFLFDLNLMDCPLFVPIIILNGKRDELQRKLIENNIYCPIHWKKPEYGCSSNLYDLELSLICDQRYNENDMRKIASIICE